MGDLVVSRTGPQLPDPPPLAGEVPRRGGGGRQPTNAAKKHSKRLRKTMTKAEVMIWQHLRKRQIHNFKFRRQCPIGPYIVDFACLDLKLAIEIDGDSHASDRGIARDGVRSSYLQENGWHILRFWNVDIYENLEGVVEAIGQTAKHMGAQ